MQQPDLVGRHDTGLERRDRLAVEQFARDAIRSEHGLFCFRGIVFGAAPRLEPAGLTDALRRIGTRDPLPMQGGTTFHFVTDGIESALNQAKRAAAAKDVLIMGGAKTIQQFLAAGLIDEVNISMVPLLLGGGERLLDNLGGPPPRFEQTRVVQGPGVVHLRYRVAR